MNSTWSTCTKKLYGLLPDITANDHQTTTVIVAKPDPVCPHQGGGAEGGDGGPAGAKVGWRVTPDSEGDDH